MPSAQSESEEGTLRKRPDDTISSFNKGTDAGDNNDFDATLSRSQARDDDAVWKRASRHLPCS